MPEIETLKSFCNTLQEDTGEDFNSSFAYGDWSDAARWISQGLKNPSEFSKLIKEQDREKFFAQAAANCESANEFEVTNRLRGIVYLSDFLAAKDVKTPVETPESLLKKSVEAFEEAWPSDSLTARSSPCEGTFFRELFEHPVGPEQQNPKKADSNDTFKTAIKKTFNAHAGNGPRVSSSTCSAGLRRIMPCRFARTIGNIGNHSVMYLHLFVPAHQSFWRNRTGVAPTEKSFG